MESEDDSEIRYCDWAKFERIWCQVANPPRGWNYFFNVDGSQMYRDQASLCAQENPVTGVPNVDWRPEDPEFIRICYGRQLTNVFERKGRSNTELNPRSPPGTTYSPYVTAGGAANEVQWTLQTTVNGAGDNIFTSASAWTLQDPFQPIGFGASLDEMIHVAEQDGRWAVFSMDVANDYSSELVFALPTLDVALFDSMGPFESIVSAAYVEDRPKRHFLDDRVAAVHELASEALPGSEIEVVDESWDGNTYLILARSARSAGDYYRLGIVAGDLELIGPAYSHLADVELAETRTLTFEAADGGAIAAHLTVPDEREGPARAIILPRAQASRLDIADPHYLVEFLAASGYTVLRVDYRGLDEYGGAWLPSRALVGRERAASDINDAAQFLIDEGYAESDRICALGWDYGAYAATFTSMEHPEALDCIVSIGGLFDTQSMGSASTALYRNEAFGDALDEASPIKRAADVSAPMLLFNGRLDSFADLYRHSTSLERELDRVGTQVQLIEYRWARHAISRQTYRIDMLTRIGRFLDEQIGTTF